MVKKEIFTSKHPFLFGLEILEEKISINNSMSFIGTVFFGSPSNKCNGHGICEIHKLNAVDDIENCGCKKRAIALISMLSSNKIRLEILKSSMSASLWHQDFIGGEFQVDSDYYFSPFTFGFQERRIKKGRYSYLEDSLFITIDFHNTEL